MTRIAILVLVAMVAISVSGAVGIGRWIDTVAIDAEVDTADLAVGVRDLGTWQWTWADLSEAMADCTDMYSPSIGLMSTEPQGLLSPLEFPECPPDQTTLVVGDHSSYTIQFLGTSDGGYTWNYRVTGNYGRSLSHWTLELCAPGVADATPPGYEIGVDPTTGVDGIKWDELPEPFTTLDFSFTLSEVYRVGTVEVGVKTGGQGTKVATGDIAGPNCEPCEPQCPPLETSHTSENIGDPLFDEPVPGYAAIEETIVDAFPGLKTGTTIMIANGGSVPVELKGIHTAWLVLDGVDPGQYSSDRFEAVKFFKLQEYDAEGNPVGPPICGLSWGELVQLLGGGCMPQPYQLHAGHRIEIDIYLSFKFCDFTNKYICKEPGVCGQCLPVQRADGTLAWEWTVDWVQWNQYE